MNGYVLDVYVDMGRCVKWTLSWVILVIIMEGKWNRLYGAPIGIPSFGNYVPFFVIMSQFL